MKTRHVKTGGIILAGGASSRMGSPKALLKYQGETFLDRLIRMFEPLCSEVVVVVGRDAINSPIPSSRTRFIMNELWEKGQLSSLQCGLSNLSTQPDAVLLTPIDYPAYEAETPAALLRQFEAGVPFVRPRFEGRRGHPILFASSLIPEFLSLAASASARDVVHRYADQTRYVDVDDPGILRDIDEPADYEALVGASIK